MAVSVKRVSPGEYLVNGRYIVRKRKAAGMYEGGVSWYWVDSRSTDRSGYFDTKAACVADLGRVVGHYFKQDGKFFRSTDSTQRDAEEITEAEYQRWNHSECQTACTQRGAEKCVW